MNNMKKYEVAFYDKTNGATSEIDVIEVEEGYTPQDYIDDCNSNGNILADIEGGNDFEILFREIKEGWV